MSSYIKIKSVIVIFLIQFLLLLYSCSSEQKKVNPEAILLNNQAMEIFNQTIFKPLSESENKLNEALFLLNKAISLDSNYLLAYNNKVNVELKLGNYNAALKTLDKIYELDNNAETISLQGFIYEKTGQLDSANKKYIQAMEMYENQINQNPELVELKAARAFMLIFTENEKVALIEINNLLKQYPNNESAIMMEQTIRHFHRESFINDR